MRNLKTLFLKFPAQEESSEKATTAEPEKNIPERKEIKTEKTKPEETKPDVTINRKLWDSNAEEKVFQCLLDFINTDSFYIVPHILVSEAIKDFRKYECFEDTYNRYCEFIKEERKNTHFELMHFDFVIYSKKSSSAVLIIEVDGGNHKTNQSTIHFDNFKDFIAKQYAAIPLVRLDLSIANVDIETELKKVLVDKKLDEPYNYPIYCYKCGKKFSYQPNRSQPDNGFYYCNPCQIRTGKNVTLSYNEKICPPIFTWNKR